MGDFIAAIASLVAVVVVVVVCYMAGHVAGEKGAYRRGQIDALTRHVHYQLTTQPNGETTWQEIPSDKGEK